MFSPQANREKVSAWQRVNRDRCREKLRRWRAKNPERVLAADRTWKSLHREEMRQADRERYRKNACARRATARERRATNPQFRIAKNLRSRLFMALRHRWKTGSAVRDLGMPVPQFIGYIEGRFQPGMTWENYGRLWHVDHVKPLSAFDLTDRKTSSRGVPLH